MVSALACREPDIRIASVRFWIDADGKPVIDIEATRVDGPRRESSGTLSVPLRGCSADESALMQQNNLPS
ncbi:conserved hypothethical protein (plasmid) [Ralstonia solanacearum PSI07]|nr:conserved hypothethical protein [Ralstonia solanacearum PSI07]